MEILTIPFVVMIISGVLWYVFAHRAAGKASDPWLLDLCRGVFFISVLVVLLSVTARRLF